MKTPVATLTATLVALAACGDASHPSATAVPEPAPVLYAGVNGIEGSFIVVLKEGADPTAVASVAGVRRENTFDEALNGFSASLNGGQLNALRHHPDVAFIEQDQVVSMQQSVPWGLDRIDQMFLPLNGTYNFATTAPNVHVYILDTGIRTTLSEFGGRAVNVFDVFGGSGDDCNGHGTGVAAIAGGTQYGVAKQARLRGVRVLNCAGSGTVSGIVTGVNWVAANRILPAVANMSIGGMSSAALNTAVNNLHSANVLVAAAAGSSNADACGFSPGGAANATTVAASDINDNRVPTSNFGSCVNLYAPGRNIPTITHTGAPFLMNGSSAAAPHVAGVAALYLGHFPGSNSGTVRNWILTVATPGVILGNVPPTPNRLLFKSTL